MTNIRQTTRVEHCWFVPFFNQSAISYGQTFPVRLLEEYGPWGDTGRFEAKFLVEIINFKKWSAALGGAKFWFRFQQDDASSMKNLSVSSRTFRSLKKTAAINVLGELRWGRRDNNQILDLFGGSLLACFDDYLGTIAGICDSYERDQRYFHAHIDIEIRDSVRMGSSQRTGQCPGDSRSIL